MTIFQIFGLALAILLFATPIELVRSQSFDNSFNFERFTTSYSDPLRMDPNPCPENKERYSLPIEGEISRVDKFFSPYQRFSAIFTLDKTFDNFFHFWVEVGLTKFQVGQEEIMW